jgi:hypothetical protein
MKKALLFLFGCALLLRGQVTSVATSCGITGGPITTTGTVSETVVLKAENTAYTILTGDCGKILTSNAGGATAYVLPQAGSSGFAAGFFVSIQNIGNGTITVTTATSTFYGAVTAATLSVGPGAYYEIVSDGTNYLVAGAQITISNGHTIFGGASPTVACGGQGVSAQVRAGSTDNAGAFTVPTSSTEQMLNCVITWASAFTNAPSMTFSVSTNGVYVTNFVRSTTAVRIQFSAIAQGAFVSWQAF